MVNAPEHVDLIITRAFVITMNDERTMYRDGAVAVRGTEIVAVGPRAEIESSYTADRVMDANGNVVMPGLINGHRHMLSTPRGSLVEGRTTLQNLKEFVYPAFAALDPEDNYWNTLANAAEMIRNGTTTFQEPGCTHLDSVVRAVDEIGIRCSTGHWAWDQLGPNSGQCPDYFHRMGTQECLDLLRETFHAVHGAANGRIRGAITIEGVGTCSDELNIGARELAAELGTVTVQHKATSVQEVRTELNAFGQRPVEHMHAIGALGPEVVLNHMTALEDFEVELVAETGTMICHNPSSALKLSKGVTQTGRFPELLRSGVVIGLGTDASNASNHSDIFRAMSLAVLLPRDARVDASVTVAEDGLDMATRGGARVSGWGDCIGQLRPGFKADLIVVDIDRPDMNPGLNVLQDLVYSATGSCVRHVVIDGRLVMENRELRTIDERLVLTKARERAVALLDRINHRIEYRWPVVG